MKHSGIYRKFWIETQAYDWPVRFGYDWFCSAIDKVWEVRYMQTDWLDFECMTRNILKSTKVTDEQKVTLLKDAVGAFTGRGKAE